jgi:hypothetical protein
MGCYVNDDEDDDDDDVFQFTDPLKFCPQERVAWSVQVTETHFLLLNCSIVSHLCLHQSHFAPKTLGDV